MRPDILSPNEFDLFEQVVNRCGLASWVGPGVLRRALQEIGVPEAGDAQSQHFRLALPQLEARMAVYLRPGELAERVADIRTLLQVG